MRSISSEVQTTLCPRWRPIYETENKNGDGNVEKGCELVVLDATEADYSRPENQDIAD